MIWFLKPLSDRLELESLLLLNSSFLRVVLGSESNTRQRPWLRRDIRLLYQGDGVVLLFDLIEDPD